MRVATCWVVAPGKISTALLLAAVPIAILVPGSKVAFSQSSTGTVAQAALFTAIDLHPNGLLYSEAYGICGGQQVGYGGNPATGDQHHALLWHDSAASVVDLHPHGFEASDASGASSGQQVGWGIPQGSPRGNAWTATPTHALLWRGSAASVIDLHPHGFVSSQVQGTDGEEQVGSGIPLGGPPGNDNMATPTHALSWRGSAASVVDLHPHGFLSTTAQGTDRQVQVGYGSPEGVFFPMSSTPVSHALLWHGSAASVVDLQPTGFLSSRANDVAGGEEVGDGIGQATGGQDHALLWHGSAVRVVDLHPRGFSRSEAQSTNGKEQAGDGQPEGNYFHAIHALLWRGTAASVVDLHAFLPPGFVHSFATGIGSNGDIVGWAVGSDPSSSHAFLWKRNMPEPVTSPGQSTTRCQ